MTRRATFTKTDLARTRALLRRALGMLSAADNIEAAIRAEAAAIRATTGETP